jgi:tight adherence protein B
VSTATRHPRRHAGVLAVAAALLAGGLMMSGASTSVQAVAAPAAGSGELRVSDGGGSAFPARSLVLSVPGRSSLSASEVHISENGAPVSGAVITQAANARPGDFGIVLAIDISPSMKGRPLQNAMIAARALARQRVGQQKLGLIEFDRTPTVALPLTANEESIATALRQTPAVGGGTHIYDALALALQQLRSAHIAAGAVILLSDGADRGSAVSEQAVAAAARASHISLYAVGVRDQSFDASSLSMLARDGGGQFLVTDSSGLDQLVTGLGSSFAGQYVVRYRSHQVPGQHVQVRVSVDGVPGAATLSYLSPGSPRAHTLKRPSPESGSSGSPRGLGVHASANDRQPLARRLTPAEVIAPSAGPKRGSSGQKSSGQKSSGQKTCTRQVRGSSAARVPTTTCASSEAASASRNPPPRGAFAAQEARTSPPNKPERRSFWTSTFALVAASCAAALLIALAIVACLAPRGRRDTLRARVGELTATSAPAPDQPAAPARSTLAALERMLERTRWWARFKEDVEIARFERSAVQLVALCAAGTIAAVMLLGAILGIAVLAVAALVLGPLSLRWIVARRLRRERALFAEQLPDHLQELASAMRAGHSLAAGIAAMAQAAIEPSRGEWGRVLADERLGMPLEDAMRTLARRMDCPDIEQVALVAALQQRTGGNMAEVIERVAEGARARADLRRELHSLTAQARLSRGIVTALPPCVFAMIAIIDPSYVRPLIQTSGGQFMLALAIALASVGWLVMRKLTDIKV